MVSAEKPSGWRSAAFRSAEQVPDTYSAHYYMEGFLKPKGLEAVPHYLTRVTQVYVKEDGRWKIRSSHWSPLAGGSGTSQTAPEE